MFWVILVKSMNLLQKKTTTINSSGPADWCPVGTLVISASEARARTMPRYCRAEADSSQTNMPKTMGTRIDKRKEVRITPTLARLRAWVMTNKEMIKLRPVDPPTSKTGRLKVRVSDHQK